MRSALIAATVRAELARRSMTATALADRLGTTQQTLSRRLTGVVPFDVDELQAIADALEISFGALVGDEVPA